MFQPRTTFKDIRKTVNISLAKPNPQEDLRTKDVKFKAVLNGLL